jgi:hypothetical protein
MLSSAEQGAVFCLDLGNHLILAPLGIKPWEAMLPPEASLGFSTEAGI